MTTPPSIASQVREVFLVPPDLGPARAAIIATAASGPEDLHLVAVAFAENLVGVIRTLSIPFQYTQSEVINLHWQRIHMAERIRALKSDSESTDDVGALEKAQFKFEAYQRQDGKDQIINDILARLLRLKEDPESLAAARELTRQGIVLVWSAMEVLARDAFVYLLDRQPSLSDLLLSDGTNRKRFSVERIDWQTLASYGFDMSKNLGQFLISRADLKNVPAIRATYQALFPLASSLHQTLSDKRLWDLSQKRHLIVHRRGLVDREYLEATGHAVAMGDDLWVTPAEVESYIEATQAAGMALLQEVANAV
ncbi:hypothetical protein [Rhodoferax bucti]|uniref:hypothetical protein n=1 Tax=Rhodoferax bucti TaxID=2576305 RepID=UPI0011096457|nr:hypothetical protein [Rhodoferax bucti]